MPDNDKKVNMWNGGKTNESHNRILRSLEDGFDLDDSELEFREELVKREKLMREEAKYQQIQSKYALTREHNDGAEQ